MPRRNVVVESARQRRLRMLCQERTEALLPLLDQIDTNRAQYNDLLVQMHDIQRRVEARRLAARIDEERRYYDYGERTLASWPQDHHEELAAPSTARFNDQRANRELEGEWEPTMPSVPCFVDRHPPGTPEHLITECQQFRRLSVGDRALFVRRLNLCWGCWLPRRYVNGHYHDGSNCEHPRSCNSCGSRRHHTAMCGAPLVMGSTLEEARQNRLLRVHC